MAIVNQTVETSDIKVEDFVFAWPYPNHGRFQFFESEEDFSISRKIHAPHRRISPERTSSCRNLAWRAATGSYCRALTQERIFLLLDEPTAHLDITHQVQILNLIRRLNRQLNLTVLMIIHDLNLAGEYCDQLIMLKEGRVHSCGSPIEVLTYQTIEEVYNTVVVTRLNPISGKPVVFLVSERLLSE